MRTHLGADSSHTWEIQVLLLFAATFIALYLSEVIFLFRLAFKPKVFLKQHHVTRRKLDTTNPSQS